MSTVTASELGLADEPWQADQHDPPAIHLRARLDTQLRALLAHEPGTRSGTDPEDLHQMRVAVRRMRSLLKHAGTLLGPDADTVRADLGWLGDALGEVRDYDVLIGHLRELVADFDERDQPAAERLISHFGTKRKRAKQSLTGKLGTARYKKLLANVAELTMRPDDAQENTVADQSDGQVSLVGTLRKPHRKFSKAVAALGPEPDDAELHELRIRGKRLRYAAELARPAAGKKSAKKIKVLINEAKKLQDALGEHQDAVVAADRMRELARESEDSQVGFVAGRIAERELTRRAEARRSWPKAAARLDAAAKVVV